MRAGPSSVATESQETSPLNSKMRSRLARLVWNSEEWLMSTGAVLGVQNAGGKTIRPSWTISTLNPQSCKKAVVCKHHSRAQHSCASDCWRGNVLCFLLQQQLEDSNCSVARMYILSRFSSRKGVYKHALLIMCIVSHTSLVILNNILCWLYFAWQWFYL